MNDLTTRTITVWAPAMLAVLLACSCTVGNSQADAPVKPAASNKIDHALIDLHDQFNRFKESGEDSEHFNNTNPQVRIANESVLIDAVAAEGATALEQDLRRLGATNLSSYGRIVSCYLPITSIGRLTGLDSLRFARAARPTTHTSRN